MSNGTRSNRVSESQLGRTEYGHDAVIFIYFISIGFIWLLYRTLIVIFFFCDLEFMHYFSCICNEFRFWRRTCSFTRHILTICLPFVFLSFHLFSFFYIFLPFLSLSLSLTALLFISAEINFFRKCHSIAPIGLFLPATKPKPISTKIPNCLIQKLNQNPIGTVSFTRKGSG